MRVRGQKTNSEKDNGDVSSVASLRPQLSRSSTQSASGMFRAYTHQGGKLSPTPFGTLSDVKRCSTRKKAENYMSKSTGPGDPLLDDPTAFIFTDGSLSQTAPQAGGSHHFPGHSGDPSNTGTSLYIPYSTSLARRSSGHQQHGELSAVYHSSDWIRKRCKSLNPASSPRYNIISASVYCDKPFATRAIKRLPTNILSLASMSSSTR